MKNKLLLLLFVLTGYIYGLTLDPIFTDHMVLQRDMPLKIYGKAMPGQEVKAALSHESASAQSDPKGDFIIHLPALSAGGPYHLEVFSGNNKITLQDILIGEVWLCTGQSNMHWSVDKTRNAEETIARANQPMIRLCKIPFRSSASPTSLPQLQWHPCSPESIKDFSAVAYHFAEKLHPMLDVAIGVIQCSFGGTPVEAWISKEYLYANARWKHLTDAFDEDCSNYEASLKNYKEAIYEWKRQETEAKKKGEKPPPRPPSHPPRGPETYNALGGSWNAMIHPLQNLTFRGVLWYQGESNRKNGWEYRDLFAELIQQWRQHFHNDKLPFLFVQISTQMHPFIEANKFSSVAELRESQDIVSKTVPHAAMVTAFDLGDDDHDIHPKDKSQLAERLCNMAMYKVYGQQQFSSLATYPSLKDHNIQGDKIIIELSHSEGLHCCEGQEPANFQIAGKNHQFHWAQAEISGDKLIVSSPEVSEPVAVRYCWSHSFATRPNLYNATSLPVLPFRTDPYPSLTKPKN